MAAGVGNHLVQNREMGLARWKGGGFGMFTTVDSNTTRFGRLLVETPTGRLVPIYFPGDLPTEFRLAVSLPQGKAPERLLGILIERPCIWLVEKEERRPEPAGTTTRGAPVRMRMVGPGEKIEGETVYVDVEALHLEIHTIAFDRETSELSTRLLRKLKLRKEP